MSQHPSITDWPGILPLINMLYEKAIAFGFSPDVCQARLKSLQNPCAFNIFIKVGVIINNKHLKRVEKKIRKTFEPALREQMVEKSASWKSMTSTELEAILANKLKAKNSLFYDYLKQLRAITSRQVLAFLEQVLRDSNIRDLRKSEPNVLLKKVSLLAIVGLMLEQVLDLAERVQEGMRTQELVYVKMTKELGRLLLTYLQPPSPLAFPVASPFNECFRRDDNARTGVSMDGDFWYELYKESESYVPAHLLLIPENESKNAQKESHDDPCAQVLAPEKLRSECSVSSE
jgi:hypothetical protein